MKKTQGKKTAPTISLYSIIFVVPSVILFIIAGYLSYQNYQFYQRAVVISGTVIKHVEKDYQPYPVIYYYDLNQKLASFQAEYRTDPFLEKGDSVELLIDPTDPLDVSLKSVQIKKWGVIYILIIIGSFFFVVGVVIPKLLSLLYNLFSGNRSTSKKLIAHHHIVDAYIASVEKISVPNNLDYFVITCQWQDPTKPDKLYIYHSGHLITDPTPYLKKTIQVYINPKNPRDYTIDLSFLPC